jgi:hypothetical protein
MTGKKPPDYSQKDSEKAAVTKLDGSRLCPRAGRPATKKKAASFQDMLDRFCRKYDHRT